MKLLPFVFIFLVSLLAVTLIAAVILGFGIAISYALRWKWPGIDFGMGILIGVVISSLALYYFFRILRLLDAIPMPADPRMDDDDDDDDDDDEPPIKYVVQAPLRRRRQMKRR
jgi:hypothetical protein